MKANEAPEKIYMNWVNYPLEEIQVEYTRTDAFIERACEWIKEKWDDNYTMPIIIDSVIDEFKNYMK